MTMAGDGSHALLVLGFESTDHPVDEALARALEICAEHGGVVPELRTSGGGDGSDAGGTDAAGGGDAVSSWREAFLGAPYVRDVLVAIGVLAETFETAITWDRFAAFHERVKASGEEALREVCGEGGRVTARFTHVYADGPAVYFTAIAPARRGEEVEQWGAVKRAVSDAIDRRGRHDHPPSRRRARSPAVV